LFKLLFFLETKVRSFKIIYIVFKKKIVSTLDNKRHYILSTLI